MRPWNFCTRNAGESSECSCGCVPTGALAPALNAHTPTSPAGNTSHSDTSSSAPKEVCRQATKTREESRVGL